MGQWGSGAVGQWGNASRSLSSSPLPHCPIAPLPHFRSANPRMSTDAKPKAGLEDVVAGESAICYLDGEHGVLAYQGYDIHDLANADRGASFEEVCYLLWHGRLPTRAELGDLQTQLDQARNLPDP